MGNWTSSFTDKRTDLQKWRYDYIDNLIEKESLTDEQGQCTPGDGTSSNIDPKKYSFPFENLVLEGGGSKGLAYCGAVQYLEDVGIMPNIKRIAGTSSGAIMAALLAVGHSSEDVKKLMGQNLETVFKDGDYFNALQNLFSYFGFHPGNRFEGWLGKTLEAQTGSADITFEEVRKKYGRELCVVVTNLSWMRTEYCHPKTTPNMPIRSAVRMSMSIPGLFTAKSYDLFGRKDVFVDGGLTSNYPIHCFDGWFLSMDKKDNFIERFLVPENRPAIYASRFTEAKVNTKTLGLLVFAENDQDFLRCAIEHGYPEPRTPEKETILYRKRMEEANHLKKAERIHDRLIQAVNSFNKALDAKKAHNSFIRKEDLKGILKDLSKSNADILFGQDANAQEVFDVLDHNKDGKIDETELINFIGELGIPLHDRSVRYRRRDILSIKDFLNRLVDTLLTNKEMTRVQVTDAERTVGIDTGHISTTDFDLDEEDKDFVVNLFRTFVKREVVLATERHCLDEVINGVTVPPPVALVLQ